MVQQTTFCENPVFNVPADSLGTLLISFLRPISSFLKNNQTILKHTP